MKLITASRNGYAKSWKDIGYYNKSNWRGYEIEERRIREKIWGEERSGKDKVKSGKVGIIIYGGEVRIGTNVGNKIEEEGRGARGRSNWISYVKYQSKIRYKENKHYHLELDDINMISEGKIGQALGQIVGIGGASKTIKKGIATNMGRAQSRAKKEVITAGGFPNTPSRDIGERVYVTRRIIYTTLGVSTITIAVKYGHGEKGRHIKLRTQESRVQVPPFVVERKRPDEARKTKSTDRTRWRLRGYDLTAE
jgi:hypothetical protein